MYKVGAGSYSAGAKRSSIEWKLVVKCMGRVAIMGSKTAARRRSQCEDAVLVV